MEKTKIAIVSPGPKGLGYTRLRRGKARERACRNGLAPRAIASSRKGAVSRVAAGSAAEFCRNAGETPATHAAKMAATRRCDCPGVATNPIDFHKAHGRML